jgi:hypothetical protein
MLEKVERNALAREDGAHGAAKLADACTRLERGTAFAQDVDSDGFVKGMKDGHKQLCARKNAARLALYDRVRGGVFVQYGLRRYIAARPEVFGQGLRYKGID